MWIYQRLQSNFNALQIHDCYLAHTVFTITYLPNKRRLQFQKNLTKKTAFMPEHLNILRFRRQTTKIIDSYSNDNILNAKERSLFVYQLICIKLLIFTSNKHTTSDTCEALKKDPTGKHRCLGGMHRTRRFSLRGCSTRCLTLGHATSMFSGQ